MTTSATASSREGVVLLLGAAVAEKLINELLEHHNVLKTAFLCQDWEKCLTRGGKLAEAVMKIIHYRRTGKVVSSIKVETEIQEAEKDKNLPDEIRLLIPRHVRSLYDHRTKRGGAHGSFDPNPLDARMVVALADWIVGELIRLYGKADPQKALRLVTGLTARLVPLVEEIDGDVLVLNPGASCREELRLILYKRYPDRTARAQLCKWVKNHTRNNKDLTLNRMERAKEVHTNNDGILLTSLGRRKAEAMISKSLP
jgi:hypothetical protein